MRIKLATRCPIYPMSYLIVAPILLPCLSVTLPKLIRSSHQRVVTTSLQPDCPATLLYRPANSTWVNRPNEE
jgi:hypothetical protein